MTATATNKGVYGTSPVKITKTRRTRQELAEILGAVQAIITEEEYATIRHVFYRLVGYKLLEKTHNEYKNLDRYLVKWRQSGELNYGSFADSSRWYVGSRGYGSLSESLAGLGKAYRRNPWDFCKDHVELWTEKKAIVNILQKAAAPLCVQIYPMGGFSSDTLLHENADFFKHLQHEGKTVYIYYFGDYDRHGDYIEKSFIKKLRDDHGVEPHFVRVAVTEEQIERYDLPTRPPKNERDNKQSTEVDTLPTQVIVDLARAVIRKHISAQILDYAEIAEKNDIRFLSLIINEVQKWEDSRRLGEAV